MPAKPKSSASKAPITAPPQTILIAVTGLSPAVLTETIWALAKHSEQPVIPDKIIVLTTLTGEQKLKEQLFGPDDLWLTLRKQLLGKDHASDPRLDFAETADRIRVFTRKSGGKRIPLDRMDTLAETEAVGDCLVEEIWNWVGRPDTQVFASISGGFKTMSALLYAAMTVLGGPRDRILHVLVGEPYDGGTRPMFYWPEQPVQELECTRPSKLGPPGTLIKAGKAELVLTDVQFPPLRELFGSYGFNEPPTFGALVAMCRNAVVNLAPPAISSLVLHPATLTAEVNALPLDISKTEFYVLWFLAESAIESIQFDRSVECADAYREFLISQKTRAPQNRRAFLEERIKALGDAEGARFTKTRSALKTKLIQAGITGKALALHLPDGKHSLTLPVELITLE
ncbi:MAG: CRISPR-associated ring nuclease Csm6 [Prosthecobacter sp.]|uniref:CRISPR-associated ring nuclease Csm6 n=1 Tax=Prosthecobacter sp. TaxID=1965333 RepID=UPI0039025ABA